ncbi:phosphotransferase [Phaeobacter marinintestinus]|uniref:phosphotransferase n=1 Tax=Falsiphaeobacter marinintestinus TaxID=1492905 RepID=UPI0011B4B194|nr:phosphotransferase [Phaeobacter marinintestinus]
MGKLPRAIDENLHFLCAEIDGQLSAVQAYFQDPGEAMAQKVILRAGYSYNLSANIQNTSVQGLSRRKVSHTTQLLLRNVDLIARNLDLISRKARRALAHAQDVGDPASLCADAYPKVIKTVRASLKQIQPALARADSRAAVRIGQSRDKLDDLYDRIFRELTAAMRESKRTDDLANSLLVANEIRRMGDALQAISEAILSVNVGQSVQFERYFSMKSLLPDQKDNTPNIEPLAETRSGSAISSVRSKDASGETVNAVFKDGELSKVKDERAGVKSWHSIYPGLAPKILSYEKSGQSAALLIEHLPGHTFEQLVLNESDDVLADAQKQLSKTLRDVWRSTRMDEPAEMNSMQQLGRRLPEVYRVHPEFRSAPSRIGSVRLDGFDDLVTACAARETKLSAPFSVHIHGDFNLDNVIYDPAENRIHFIDLHRSRYMDYVQDVSVFMVSNYRLQIQDVPLRRRLAKVACDTHAVAAKFARTQKDSTFEYRMALGLARSFASSTRFVFDKSHARRMYVRARFLSEQALTCPEGRETRFKLPIRELFFD